MNAPCFNCPERKTGCHAECDRYAQFKKVNDANREHRIEQDSIDSVVFAFSKRR